MRRNIVWSRLRIVVFNLPEYYDVHVKSEIVSMRLVNKDLGAIIKQPRMLCHLRDNDAIHYDKSVLNRPNSIFASL